MQRQVWVDFRAIKKAVSIEQVLTHYNVVVGLKRSGSELRGRCPIHQGEGVDAFHVNVAKNCFHCWSCKARGNVLDLVAALEQCSVREAGEKLQDLFFGTQQQKPLDCRGVVLGESRTGKVDIQNGEQQRARKKETGERAQNAPLTFQLKNVDPHHPYLQQRGIRTETAAAFGLGFFSGNGSMSGRVVIPIHNELGQLIGYAGRSIDDSEPKYRLPAGFHKSLALFNFHRAVKADGQGRVIVVEGFFDCLQVHQAGFANVIALMGCELSAAQQQLLVSSFYEVVLMLDGDEAGAAASVAIAGKLAGGAWVRIAEVPRGKQPDQMNAHELQMVLGAV